MAASKDGYRVDLKLFPEGNSPNALDSRPIAIATFVKDPAVSGDPLFAHVLDRRSLKEPYDLTRSVSSQALNRIKSAAARGSKVDASNEKTSVDALRKLTHEALAIEVDTPRTYMESVDLFRIGKTEIEANPDGIDLSGPLIESLHFLGAMSRESLLDTTSTTYAEGRKAVLENTDTAMAHIWQVSSSNSRENQINSGRDWVRLNLAATKEGIGMQPLSQALQEYPEMKSIYKQAHKMLAPDGGTIQMLARLGFAPPVAQSPRWPLEAKILKE